jgi:hypothetical protein
MDRDIYPELLRWKESEDRKPLIIRGVRQCGKTYIMKYFGACNYSDVAYCKFEGNESLCRIFDGDLDCRRIVSSLSIHLDMDITENTLIIFDEIQECERAMTSLKSFYEDAPQYHIICAGSLLGLQGEGSFPVGKVSFAELRPMSFREFLRAANPRLYGAVMDAGVPDAYSSGMLQSLFKEYLAVGGMPEAVSKWIETGNMGEVDRIHREIADSFKLDFMKHVPDKDIKKVNMIWDSIPSQLAKENRRFFFGHAVKGARSAELEDALQWLLDAGMVYKLCRTERVGIPLGAHLSDNLFKLYMMDVGIMRHKAGVSASHIMEDRLDETFLGGFMENLAMCEMSSYGHAGEAYWVSGNEAEVDFLVTSDRGVIPVEVKSGKRYRAASLKEYIDRYDPEAAAVISDKGYGRNGKVVTVPLYAIWLMDGIFRDLMRGGALRLERHRRLRVRCEGHNRELPEGAGRDDR